MKQREEYSEKKKGLVGTIVFHAIVLTLLFFLGYFTPLPLPGEEGILVNFGDTENGLGEREPSPARKQTKTPPPPPKREEKKVSPPPTKTPPPPQISEPEPQPAKEVAMTQDYEKTVAIDAAKKKKHDEEQKRKKELDDKKRKEQALKQAQIKREQEQESQRLKQEKIEQQRLEKIEQAKREEAEKKAKLEAEQKAREQAELQRKAEEQQKINEINSRTAGAFAKSGQGSGGTGSSDGKSQGVTFPGGNQGVATGDPNANKYGPGGSGSGDQGSGVSYNLNGRSANSLPKPKYPGNDAGIVVVTVRVDNAGRVTSAEPGAQGTTIMDQAYWGEAKQAAMKAKFNADPNAAAFQQGTISYHFVLD